MERALTRMFNIILHDMTTPTAWSKENITLLYIGGDRGDITNYRVISITSTIGRLFSKIIAARLLKEAEGNDWLPENPKLLPLDRNLIQKLLT
jgi:hypothetical protein